MRSAAERCKAMQDAINEHKIKFLSMNEDEREKYLSRYSKMSNYEQVALSQIKKHMTNKEKAIIKTEISKMNEEAAEKQQQAQ